MERKQKNLQKAKNFFDSKLERLGYKGVIGFTGFRKVYFELMPIQRKKMQEICDRELENFIEKGSIICLGIAYPESVIDKIDARFEDGTTNKDDWNIYAKEYHRINRILDCISKDLSELFSGIAIPATIEGVAGKINNVEDYYAMTVSHRVVAENAGLGWRGKNELVVNSKFSCALRFASILTTLPFPHSKQVKNLCGSCTACVEVCPFLRNRDKLKNYREKCRLFINQLDLDADVCGKCIRACYRHSIFSNEFKLD